MSFLKNIFSTKSNSNKQYPVSVDIHSHLLPGIDDGAKSIEESIELLKRFKDLGVKKLICTPHIMFDYYKNTPEIISSSASKLTSSPEFKALDLKLEFAAEYYFDEYFLGLVNSDQPLLTFGPKKYLLFETAFMGRPQNLKELIFNLQTKGYTPVLAHPERYMYFHDSFEEYEDLVDRGVVLQLNYISLSGYYSKEVKKIAERLIDAKLVRLIGSDCHGNRHIEAIEKTISEKYSKKLEGLDLLNNSL